MVSKSSVLFLFLFSFFLPSLLPSAFARVDVDQLKADVESLRASAQNSNSKLAEAMNQLMALQQQINAMQGTVDSGGHFYEEQTRALKEYDQRFSALEDKMNALLNLFSEIKQARAGEKITGADEGQTKEFQRLLDYVQAEDYSKALAGFGAFLQKYPRSSLADAAQYWVAECHYGLHDFKKAISEYQILIQKYPRSSKVKAAYLKQGLSFMGLKMFAEARPFFEKVQATYPESLEAARAQGKIKEIDRLLAPAVPTPESKPNSSTSPTINQPQPSNPPHFRPVSGGMYD